MPRIACWDIFSRPWRDCSGLSLSTQDSRPGLLSAVPAGLFSGPTGSHADSKALRHCILRAARLNPCPSYGECFRRLLFLPHFQPVTGNTGFTLSQVRQNEAWMNRAHKIAVAVSLAVL